MLPAHLRTKKVFLILTAIVMSFAFAGWMALLNNFVIEKANFSGVEIGYLQSLREIPGFLAFTAVFLLLAMTEQRLALMSLALLTIGVAITGLFPFEYGLYATTVLMSVGFHYFEAINQSLQLQYLSKEEAPVVLGQLISWKSGASLLAYGAIWLCFNVFVVEYSFIYMLFGGVSFALLVVIMTSFPTFTSHTEQHKHLVLRKRYWLFYLLTFLGGARRQIFVVFAGFMMVEKFGYDVSDIAALYIINHMLNIYLGPKIGKLIGRIGERRALTIEYTGLIVVFVGYALVEDATIAAGLYVIDHLFFAMAIAIKTFFQKIADPADMASTAGVSFSINHIAAVILPAMLGLVWMVNPAMVFYIGAGLAVLSLVSSQYITHQLNEHKLAMANQKS
ncbi:MAG: MFS transporter [Psychrosphaera sp.]|nr:MFS transporter [Psychrosphaera sp.]